jgi:hypothetical protein
MAIRKLVCISFLPPALCSPFSLSGGGGARKQPEREKGEQRAGGRNEIQTSLRIAIAFTSAYEDCSSALISVRHLPMYSDCVSESGVTVLFNEC